MDDLISRQAVIEAVLDRMDIEKHGRNAKPEEVVWALENLPPVQPKTGHWVHDGTACYCSECKKSPHRDYNKWDVFSPGVWILSDFCPKCGADMRGES